MDSRAVSLVFVINGIRFHALL